MGISKKQLFENIIAKQSFLCVGLDTDPVKIPKHILSLEDPVFEFNKAIVDATHDLCIAYKPNLAFYEAMGLKGWESLEKTAEYIKNTYPEQFLIADAKRGDIGNTSKMYAKAFFERLPFDAITVAPYMGQDSVSPFLSFENKWVILLALTSNQGGEDIQNQFLNDGNKQIFELVMEKSQQWGNEEQLMYVVGATKADRLKSIREIAPDYFLLIPGVGAQGGDLSAVIENGINGEVGLIVNASRSIIFAGSGDDFARSARKEALSIQNLMAAELKKRNFV